MARLRFCKVSNYVVLTHPDVVVCLDEVTWRSVTTVMQIIMLTRSRNRLCFDRLAN